MNNYVKVFLLNINIVNNRYFLILWVVFFSIICLEKVI